MYGTPRADTRTQGKVMDKDGNPISGIKVQLKHSYSTPNPVETAADGSYDITEESIGTYTTLVFTDVDGPEKGGEFAEKELEVKFTEADRIKKGDGSWYKGSFSKSDVDVTLDKQE